MCRNFHGRKRSADTSGVREKPMCTPSISWFWCFSNSWGLWRKRLSPMKSWLSTGGNWFRTVFWESTAGFREAWKKCQAQAKNAHVEECARACLEHTADWTHSKAHRSHAKSHGSDPWSGGGKNKILNLELNWKFRLTMVVFVNFKSFVLLRFWPKVYHWKRAFFEFQKKIENRPEVAGAGRNCPEWLSDTTTETFDTFS